MYNKNAHEEKNDKFYPLLMRIRTLRAYMSDIDLAVQLVAEGQSPATVWLYIKAAEILDGQGNSTSSEGCALPAVKR